GTGSYTGETVIEGGTLQVSGGAALPDTTAVTLAGGATLAVDTSETIGSLAGAGSVNVGAAQVLTTGGNGADTTFSGVIGGAGGLLKAGAGTLTLSGANNYSGGTTVAGGTLRGDAGSLQGDIENAGAVVFDQSTDGIYAGA